MLIITFFRSCVKVMFSVVSVRQSVSHSVRVEWSTLYRAPPWKTEPPPAPPRAGPGPLRPEIFKLVHYKLCTVCKRVVDILLECFILLPLANKVWAGNVFTPVWQSFCSEGGGVHPTRQTSPPPQRSTTEAGGTYPTGMHSCS